MIEKNEVNFAGRVIHLLHRASQIADQHIEQAIAGTGLTARQLVVMDVVGGAGTVNQTQVCAATGIDRSTVADIVRRLAQRRLIQRRRDRKDSRANMLKLTDEGASALAQAGVSLAAAERQLLAPLADNRKRELVALLRVLTGEPAGRGSRTTNAA